jgi:hypothetical protein
MGGMGGIGGMMPPAQNPMSRRPPSKYKYESDSGYEGYDSEY